MLIKTFMGQNKLEEGCNTEAILEDWNKRKKVMIL